MHLYHTEILLGMQGFFVVDAFTSIPWDVVLSNGVLGLVQLFKATKVVKLIRMIRVLKLIRILRLVKVRQHVEQLLLHVMCNMYHFQACDVEAPFPVSCNDSCTAMLLAPCYIVSPSAWKTKQVSLSDCGKVR
jgi:hypothetical protein